MKLIETNSKMESFYYEKLILYLLPGAFLFKSYLLVYSFEA
jgi:hypothetical protein